MRIPRIYVPFPLAIGSVVTLEQGPANHVAKVLRLISGNKLIVFNGHGGEYQAVIEQIDKHFVHIRIDHYRNCERETPLSICLAQSISRGERMDYTLQKTVELGVGKIAPLFTKRCGIQLDEERLRRRYDHWQAVIVSACEQCGRNRLPTLLKPAPFQQWLEETQHWNGLKLMLHPEATQGIKALSPSTSLVLLVGPEGGLDETEVAAAQQAGYLSFRLGPRILRTETAALAAITAMLTLWGDLC